MTSRSAYHIAAAVFFLLLSLQPARASTWSVQPVDNTATATGSYLSMAVDPAGKLHIGYLDTTSSTLPVLKYATDAGGSWSAESLRAYMPGVVNSGTATVYTPGGPRIMAYSSNPSTGEYKYQALRKVLGDGWQLQDIAGGKYPNGMDQPIVDAVQTTTQTGAVQHQGFTFITYSDGATLWYANEKDFYYYPFQGTGSGSGNQSDLALDSSGAAHILYYNPVTANGFNQGLMYAVNNTTPTNIVAGALTNPCVGIDGSNTLHVAYLDSVRNIRYMYKTSAGGWSAPVTVATAGNRGGYLTLKMDGAGGVHLAWYYDTTSTTGVLRYLSRTPAGSWGSVETVADSGYTNYGQYAAMAIDHNNNVSIAYYAGSNTSLRVVKKVTPSLEAAPSPTYFGNVPLYASSPQTLTVTNRGGSDLTLAASNAVALGTGDLSQFSIGANTCNNGTSLAPGASCTVTVDFTPTSFGAKSATLVLTSNDPVIAARSVELRGMSYEPPDSFSIDASAGIGGTITPAGATSVTGGNNLSYSFSADSGYIVSQVTVDGVQKGALNSYQFVEVSGNHTIEVSFAPVVPVSTWQITEVDNSATTGKYCSITPDPAGKLHVGYIEETNPRKLKYATNRSGSWAFEQVSVIPDITSAGTATVFSEGIGPRVMAYSYNTGTGARKYGAARKWTDAPPPPEAVNGWQLQYIAGDFWDPPANTMPQLPIYSVSTDTFTGATQFEGKTFITYTDGSNLWYANERDYYYHKLDPTAQVAGAGKQSDLVLDPTGNIHIAYYTPGSAGTGELRYGTGQGGSAEGYTETVLIAGITSDPSITMDGNGGLHIGYIQSGRVKYLNKPAGGAWSAPYDIGPCGNDGKYTSIKANGLNIVHLTYYSDTGSHKGSVMYAQRSAAGVWSIPMPVWMEGDTATTDYGSYAAMAVDDHHNVSIAYYDITRSALKVARKQIPVIIASPEAVLFNDVPVGSQASRDVTVSNGGLTGLTLGTAAITGPDASEFAISASGCSAGTGIAPGAAGCTITITFTRASQGDKSATLHIPSTDHYTPDQQVALSAANGAVTYTIDASAADHGAISPSGAVPVVAGADQCFTIVPVPGFFTTSLIVDGNPLAGDTYYCFNDVSADHSILAVFSSYVKVGEVQFGSLQSAYDASGPGAPIKARAVSFDEDLSCNLPKETLFSGGFDYLFTSQTGFTTLRRNLEVTSGGFEVENLGLE